MDVTDGRISPRNVLRSPSSVTVTKLVMMTSSLGIIISDRNAANRMFRPRNSSRAKANAENTMTISISAVVANVKINVFRKYRASGTAVKASR